jgi:hypothetical protein
MLEDIKSEEFTVLKRTSLELEANGQHHTLQVIGVRLYDPHSESCSTDPVTIRESDRRRGLPAA